MLRNHIERRERRWHNRDRNRYPRKFEWGVEHLGLENGVSPTEALERYVEAALADSDRFYASEPAPSHEFDGTTLKFPSAIQTPHEVNNTVWGRLFPSTSKLAVIVLPQWNAKWHSQIRLCRVLQRFGITALRLSLPYHDHRRPEHLERAEYLIGPNVGQTIASTRQAVLDVRRAADWLSRRGYERLGILGTSIGSCIGFLTMAHDKRFECGAFIHVSSHFADVVWDGLSTSHVRESLERSTTLDDLRRFWSPISPYPFIHRLGGTGQKLLVLAGRYDLSFPYELSRKSFREFDRHGLDYELTTLPCGHYTMAHFPFYAIVGFRVVKFLRRFRD